MKVNKQVERLKEKLKIAKANIEVWKWNYKQMKRDRDDWRKQFIKLKKMEEKHGRKEIL